MALALKTNIPGYEKGSIRNAVSFALSSAAAQARQRVRALFYRMPRFRETLPDDI